jgi:sensor histidine kinase regulating citrate/malate metabolism
MGLSSFLASVRGILCRPLSFLADIAINTVHNVVNLIKNAVEAMEKNTSERVFIQGFSTRSENRGYGLHDTANFVIEMGGKLTGLSAGPSQGACFEVRLASVAKR